jgi:DNA primase
MHDMQGLADEGVTWRLSQAAEARNRAQRPQDEDDAEYELGPNGARIDRGERSAFADLLQRIGYANEKPDPSDRQG